MNIDAYIKMEAPNNDTHDIAYAIALKGAYVVYKDMLLTELKEWQRIARSQYNSSHNSTAECMILSVLINEKED